jgi:hypothetical protein
MLIDTIHAFYQNAAQHYVLIIKLFHLQNKSNDY